MVWPHPRAVMLYARSSNYYDNMFIICIFSDVLSDFKTCFGQKKCGNVGHNVTFLDVTSTWFPSLVPCFAIYFT